MMLPSTSSGSSRQAQAAAERLRQQSEKVAEPAEATD